MLKEQAIEICLHYLDLCQKRDDYTPAMVAPELADQILALFPQGDKDGVLAENKYRDFINSAWEVKPSPFDKLSLKQQICILGKADGFDDGVNAQHALDNQSKQAALKAQMERVIGVIDKSYLYLRSLCLFTQDDGELARGYDLAMNESLSQLATLKAELEGENG